MTGKATSTDTDTNDIDSISAFDFPQFTSGDQRPYWAFMLTDFCAAIKVAKDENEEVPTEILNFAQRAWDWVSVSNDKSYLARKIEWHAGDVPGNPDGTGLPRWYRGFRTRETITFD